ncbi:MAG: sensor histidine kinase, partial [Planctomycetota bacterium]
PDAKLAPAADEVSDRRLFTLPVVLVAPEAPSLHRWTATHTALLVTWAVVVLAMAGTAFALKKSVDFGVRQRRFASLVTHELRSPLTTFRLYSDMLAQGLVKEEKRAVYHDTLRQESGRMARMVENVISHARLEEGRTGLSRRQVTLAALLEEAAPALRRCAEGAGFPLAIGEAPAATLFTDPAAVGQILFNLVENACKYGRSPIEVSASVDGSVRISVRDRGPGVPAAARLFRPFERAGRDEADPVRGLGLGLALSRGLARDLGGDLAHETPADGGACFVLTLPVTSRA